MINTLKVSSFIVLIVIAIAGFASMIPQLESPAPEVLDISGNLSGAELATLGQTIYESPEAGCTACHAIGHEGLRGPDLAGIGAAAGERVNGESAEEYLHKSIAEPCDYVVEGFDCIMPPTLLQTLGPAKVTALTAYLQSLGGEVTVRLSPEQTSGNAESVTSGIKGSTAEEILSGAGCTACHLIGAIGIKEGVGPDLSTIGSRLTGDEIRLSILKPDAVLSTECKKKDASGNLAPGPCLPGVMPKDYGQKLSADQLETLVTFLSERK